jgi:lambda family phage portal protein
MAKRASLADIQSAARVSHRMLRARFDSAETTDDNRKHWSMADGLSADAAASPGVRRILRNRSRYEAANNTYAKGIVQTLANDCVGTGPRLRLTAIKRETARLVEKKFSEWATAIGLAEKLRTMREARATDGESFGLLVNNPGLPTKVQLDVRLVEAEQIASYSGALPEPNSVDGIKFDSAGNPTQYEVLPYHPGGTSYRISNPVLTDAAKVLHFFIPERAGQRRGLPEMAASLPLFAQLRRWTLAVLTAAETAANLAAVMKTQEAPGQDEAQQADAFERIEFERNALMTLPAGYDITQFKPEQPTSTYAEVKREILNEIARCFQVPYNVAAGNSSAYNYSSGRLDFQIYERAIWVDRTRMESQVLDRIFAAWAREAVLVEGYLPQEMRMVTSDWSHSWHWDGFAHIDPQSEAEAQKVRLASGTTTIADEWAREGEDWEEKLEEQARIEQRKRELAAQYGGGGTSVEVQSQAMNGIQITAMTGVLEQVRTGTLPPAAAKAVLAVAFPRITADQIAAMVDAIPAGSSPAPAPQPQGAAA